MSTNRRIRKHRNLIAAAVQPLAEQHRAARALRPEWQNFLDETEYAFQHDALSKEVVTLEEAGLEESEPRTIFGLFAEGVSSGVRAICDTFYEDDSAEFMAG